jgi:hypothetical protein
MQYTIEANLTFYFELSLKQVELLIELSITHYDHACRNLSAAPNWDKRQHASHGLLYFWKNQLLCLVNDSKLNELSATSRDLDLILKNLSLLEHLDIEKARIAIMMRDLFNKMLIKRKSLNWRATFNTNDN